tara:strand:+ start:924 stop:1064 length:141 start_codon:yes stop_codon:yes gene_type:complete
MKLIETYFIPIAFLIVFFSVINMVSSKENDSDENLKPKLAHKIQCR